MAKTAHKPPRQEFERKFLVVVPLLPHALPEPVSIVQGYLHREEPYDRIRVTDGREAVLEYKASQNFESEKLPMPMATARYLLARHRVGALVEKLRHEIPSPFARLTFEIDKFMGENDPLWILELEHPRDFRLDRKLLPEYVGREVTKDPRFKNRNLATRPFCAWSKRERKDILKEEYP
jgi:CYTH domain-containing protein